MRPRSEEWVSQNYQHVFGIRLFSSPIEHTERVSTWTVTVVIQGHENGHAMSVSLHVRYHHQGHESSQHSELNEHPAQTI